MLISIRPFTQENDLLQDTLQGALQASPRSLGELPHLGDGRGLGPTTHLFTAFAATSEGLLHMVLRHSEGSQCLSGPPALRQVGTLELLT